MTAVAITTEQLEQLKKLFSSSQAESLDHLRLTQAAAAIDRCDGSVPEATRQWLRAVDGWKKEGVSDQFVLRLAKLTSSGELLEEIRNATSTGGGDCDTWPKLFEHLTQHFLSACETLKLQTLLESSKQRSGETISAYIRRFRAEAGKAYPSARAASEETRVVARFLHGFRASISNSTAGVAVRRKNHTSSTLTHVIMLLEEC